MTLHPDSTISMFDDHCCQITGGGTYVDPTGASRGLELKLDQQGHSATLAHEYTHGSNFDADYMGSTQPLAGGGAFVGWGSQSNFSMFDKSSKMTLDVVLPRPDITYRATVEKWVGLPRYPPVGAARVKDGKTTVYARAGTAPPRSRRGGSWPAPVPAASWGRDRRPIGLRDRRSRCARAIRRSRSRRSTRAAGCSGRPSHSARPAD